MLCAKFAARTVCLATWNVPVPGSGAHVWLFFDAPIPAELARRFGSALLTEGAKSVNLKDFKTYDRMLPTQEHLPDGGLGNLIALPLQGQALRQGNSAFVDENWNAYPNQWEYLKSVQRISKEFVERKTALWSADGELGTLSKTEDIEDTEKPWKKSSQAFHSEDGRTADFYNAYQRHLHRHIRLKASSAKCVTAAGGLQQS